MKKKVSVPYCLGFDTGVENTGHAAIDKNFNVIKFRHKKEIGVTQNKKANTAQDRRNHRSTRRRYHHRDWRLKQFENYLGDIIPDYFAEQGFDYLKFLKAFHNYWISPKDTKRKKIPFDSELNKYKTKYHAMVALLDKDDPERKEIVDYLSTYIKEAKNKKQISQEDIDKEIPDPPEDPVRRLILIFEVLHPLIKYRGNFLEYSKVSDFDVNGLDYNAELTKINKALKAVGRSTDTPEAFQIDINKEKAKILKRAINNGEEIDEIAKILNVNFSYKADQRKDEIKSQKLNSKINKNICKYLIKLILGNNTGINQIRLLFNYYDDDLEFNDTPIKNFKFGGKKAEEQDRSQKILELMEKKFSAESAELLDDLYDFYRKIQVFKLIPEGYYLKHAISSYYTFKEQLSCYKKALKTVDDQEVVKNMSNALNSYLNFEHGQDNKKSIDYQTFINKIKNQINDIKSSPLYKDRNEFVEKISNDIENKGFLKKQRSLDNVVIPHQIIQLELRKIIKAQSKVTTPQTHQHLFSWLADNDLANEEENYNLERFVDFRVPYYVGPLDKDNSSEFSWIVWNEDNLDLPLTIWNFNKKINFGKTVKNFIKRMTATDTYLLGEPVLPASSLIYQKYEVLNELNKVKIKNKLIPIEDKKKIYENFFKNADYKDTNIDTFCEYLKKDFAKYNSLTTDDITGLGGKTKFNSSLSTYKVLDNDITNFAEDLHNPCYRSDIEKIIEILTIFDRNSVKLKEKEINKLKIVNNKSFDINKVVKLKFNNWGRFSKKLLCELKSASPNINQNNGRSILDILWGTHYNFQQIINKSSFTFKEQINEYVANATKNETRDEKITRILEQSRISSYNERSIRQIISIVDDYTKFNNREPSMIAIEFAREHHNKKEREEIAERVQATRHQRVKKIVDSSAIDLNWSSELLNEFNSFDKTKFGLKEYLYFTQGGKDIYDCSKINLNDLYNYDIDHIYARSKNGGDNSLDNLVLTSKINNEKKGDKPAVIAFENKKISIKQLKKIWKELRNKKLISEQKYKNLITDWTDKNLDISQRKRMLARSLVDTRALTKITTQILSQLYPSTKIVAINANLSSELRQSFNLYKVREVNDFHHAVDAYLAAFGAQFMWNLYPALRPMLDYNDYLKFYPLKGKKNNKEEKQQLDDKKIKEIDLSKFGYAPLYSKEHPLVKNGYIKNVGCKEDIIHKLNRFRNPKWISVVHRTLEKGNNDGGLFNETIHKAKNTEKAIPRKQNLDPKIYGYYNTPSTKYMVLVRITKTKKYQLINVPNGLNTNNKNKLDQLIKRKLNNKKYTILVRKLLPFTMAQSVIKINNQNYTIHFLINSADGPTNYDQLWLPDKCMKLLQFWSKDEKLLFVDPKELLKIKTLHKDVLSNFRKAANQVNEETLLSINKEINNLFNTIIDGVDRNVPIMLLHTPWQSLKTNKEKFYNLDVKQTNSEKMNDEAKLKLIIRIKYFLILAFLEAVHAIPKRSEGSNLKFGRLKIELFTGELGRFKGWKPNSKAIKAILNDDTQLIFKSPSGLFERRYRLGDL